MNEIVTAIQAEASLQNLDWRLLQAICEVESSLNPKAVRFEPQYRYLFQVEQFAKKLRISKETEEATQKFSYGLGQVMGAVCRGYGFDAPLLLLASDWRTALKYSARHLSNYAKTHEILTDVIACYNAGSVRKKDSGEYVNQVYVDKVMKIYRELS